MRRGIFAGAGVISGPPVTPLYWWDSTDASTIFLERTGASATTPATVGGLVGTWKSKGTGSPIYAVTTADGYRPTRQASYVDFATSRWLSGDLPSSIPQPYTIIDLVRPVSSSDTGWAVHFQAGLVGILRYGATGYPHDFYAGVDFKITPATNFGTDYTFTAVGDGASSVLRRNGYQVTGNAGTLAINTNVRFNRNFASNSSFAHRIHQRMIFDRRLTSDEISATEAYLTSLAGFTI